MLEEQTILVTGASSGIGAATVRMAAARGAAVVLCARRAEKLDAVAREVTDMGAEVKTVVMDVRDPASVRAGVRAAAAWRGGLDGAVNNAGALGAVGRVDELDDQGFRDAFETNLFGLGWCLREELRHMVDRGRGSIVNISSVAAKIALPELAPYAASKAAVDSLTRSVSAGSFASGVRVNVVAPGPVDTPMGRSGFGSRQAIAAAVAATPAGRSATPDEVAETICFLLSDASRMVSGQIWEVDGGYRLAGP